MNNILTPHLLLEHLKFSCWARSMEEENFSILQNLHTYTGWSMGLVFWWLRLLVVEWRWLFEEMEEEVVVVVVVFRSASC